MYRQLFVWGAIAVSTSAFEGLAMEVVSLFLLFAKLLKSGNKIFLVFIFWCLVDVYFPRVMKRM